MSPWVRIDENAMEHHKIGNLSDGGFRLWVQGLAHCQKFLTDGFIADGAVRLLRAYSPKRRAELLTSGLWEISETGVSVHDFLQWNDSREQVMSARQAARARMSRLRRSSGEQQPNFARSSESVRDNTPRNVTEHNKQGVSTPPAKPRGVQGAGAGSGTYPRDHLRCVSPCGRVCFPDSLLPDFVKLRGGDVAAAESFVLAWKARVLSVWSVTSGARGSDPIGDDRFAFWRARWREEFGTTATPALPPPAPSVPDWQDECQRLHGGACDHDPIAHHRRKLREAVSA